jgi:hypothetical protein
MYVTPTSAKYFWGRSGSKSEATRMNMKGEVSAWQAATLARKRFTAAMAVASAVEPVRHA